MHLDWQNLNDSGKAWAHGRLWLRRSGEWWRQRFGTLQLEWHLPCSHIGWGVTIGGGDGGRDFGVTFAIPPLVTLYLTFDNAFARQVFEWHVDRGSDRQISVSFHSHGMWYQVWVGSMASWSRSYPWCRWWRQGHVDFARLLGKEHYTTETLQAKIPITIPMPEGNYQGEAKIERQTWKRTLWFRRVRVSTWIDVPRGIPFSGKGENSWDCGDDGLFGCGINGVSIGTAIRHFQDSVFESRRKYGQPSQQAIREALST